MHRSLNRTFTICAVFLSVAGCGDEPSAGLPYEIDTSVIIHPDGTVNEEKTPNGDACIDLGEDCVAPQEVCGSDSSRADIVVDGNGKVIEVVCYPIEDDGSLVQVDEKTAIATEPGDVVVLDDAADGPDLIGDVRLAGGNTGVFGFDPSTALVDGDVTLSGAETIARGVRITGNLSMPGGNVSAIFVEVEGDVIITGNGALLANSVVHGEVQYSGSNLELVGNALQGDLNASSSLQVCSDNVQFTDSDEDLFLDRPEEITGDFLCP